MNPAKQEARMTLMVVAEGGRCWLCPGVSDRTGGVGTLLVLWKGRGRSTSNKHRKGSSGWGNGISSDQAGPLTTVCPFNAFNGNLWTDTCGEDLEILASLWTWFEFYKWKYHWKFWGEMIWSNCNLRNSTGEFGGLLASSSDSSVVV